MSSSFFDLINLLDLRYCSRKFKKKERKEEVKYIFIIYSLYCIDLGKLHEIFRKCVYLFPISLFSQSFSLARNSPFIKGFYF